MVRAIEALQLGDHLGNIPGAPSLGVSIVRH
jgi:hypothetical protein